MTAGGAGAMPADINPFTGEATMTFRSSLRALACIAAACGASLAAQAAPSYHLVDLGAGTGATGINDHGVVSGISGISNFSGVGSIWRDGAWLPRAQSTGFSDIDDQGELVGWATIGPDGNAVPAYWPHGGGPVQIDSPFTPKRTVPVAVASGRVAGYAYGTTGPYHCFEWTPAGGYVDLAGSNGTGYCTATDINDAGQVTGDMTPVGAAHPQAFIWQDGVMRFLGTLPGGTTSYGMAINGKGHVAVNADRLLANGSMGQHAALWNGERLVDLGVIHKRGDSQAAAMNDHDDVVGREFDLHGVSTLFLYTSGQMFDLPALVDNLGDWQLTTPPSGIAADGTIVGSATLPGSTEQHAYMLVPAAPLH